MNISIYNINIAEISEYNAYLDKIRITKLHTCHILPPSEIDSGLCLAVFAGSGGKYLFHRIG